jgi:hypothetical protein
MLPTAIRQLKDMKDVQIRKEESKVLLFENNPRYVYI